MRPIIGGTPQPIQPAQPKAPPAEPTAEERLAELQRRLTSPETKAEVKKQAAQIKEDAGSILDNVSAAAKLTNGVGQALRLRANLRNGGVNLGTDAGELADRLAGKADRRINYVMETDKAILDKVKDVVGVQKAPIGMRGSLAERGLVKTAADGTTKRTLRAARLAKQGKITRMIKDAPGVRQLRVAAGHLGDRIADSKLAGKRRAFAASAHTYLDGKAAQYGAKAAETGGKLAPKLAGQAAKLGAEAALKGAGRFAPGVNIAIAGVDAYSAWKTLKDPEASPFKKGAKVATAVFSGVAATNVPVVSQVGAGLSIASEVAANVTPQKAWQGAKHLGEKAAHGVQSLFSHL